jgi:hypothetical protein
MTYALRRALAAIVGILVLGWIVSGCSGSTRDSGAVGTTGESGSAITIETSSLFVTVENRAGGPLLDLRVTISPVGGATTFTSISGDWKPVRSGTWRSASSAAGRHAVQQAFIVRAPEEYRCARGRSDW